MRTLKSKTQEIKMVKISGSGRILFFNPSYYRAIT